MLITSHCETEALRSTDTLSQKGVMMPVNAVLLRRVGEFRQSSP